MTGPGSETERLGALFEARSGDAAIGLMARTAAALRADADYFHREDDVAAGVILADEAPARLAEDALDRALAQIDAAAALDERAAEAASGGDERLAELQALPSPVREAALEALKHRGWSFAGFGVRRLALMKQDGALAELVRVEPGFGAAEHDHAAEELTLVLTGAYDDGQGRYEPGDVARAQPGFLHAPRAMPGEVCYLMLVTYGPAKFTGRIGLLQKLTGFPWSPRV
jgi:putative transcriptional regulator